MRPTNPRSMRANAEQPLQTPWTRGPVAGVRSKHCRILETSRICAEIAAASLSMGTRGAQPKTSSVPSASRPDTTPEVSRGSSSAKNSVTPKDKEERGRGGCRAGCGGRCGGHSKGRGGGGQHGGGNLQGRTQKVAMKAATTPTMATAETTPARTTRPPRTNYYFIEGQYDDTRD